MDTKRASIARYETRYGYHRVLDLPWNAAVARAKEALNAEGFGVLCEIDVTQKLKEKLGLNFYRYFDSWRVQSSASSTSLTGVARQVNVKLRRVIDGI